jgi:DNA-nicking Smr family endonuclease
MAKKQVQKQAQDTQRSKNEAKKESAGPGFHTPFQGLKRLANQPAAPAKGIAAKAPSAPMKAAPMKAASLKAVPMKAASPMVTAVPAPPVKPPAPANPEDDEFFARAMRGVTPLTAVERGRRAAPATAQPPPSAPRRRGPARNEDADAEAELADLVTGVGRPTLDEDAPGSHAGRAPGIDRRLLRRLRDGDYPLEAQLDLHGRAREEAEQILERFIAQSQGQGRRCVLVIHGRGLNSGDAGPVLRDATQRILSGSRVGRAVLAFTLAGPAQGGDGATLVLLRKKKS